MVMVFLGIIQLYSKLLESKLVDILQVKPATRIELAVIHVYLFIQHPH